MAKPLTEKELERLKSQRERLTIFLVDLAISPTKRAAFENNPAAAMKKANLTPASIAAIKGKKEGRLTRQLQSLQSTGGGLASVTVAKKKAAKKK